MDISAVIVNFNGEKFLERNIRSLLAQKLPFSQIIFVDNHSSDRSVSIIHRFPQVSLIELPVNSGYAAACNRGITACRSDLVFIGNGDIFLDVQFNRHVVSAVSRDRGIGMISPLILRFDKSTIDSAGQRYSPALYPVEIGYNRPIENTDLCEGPVFSVCGAATVFHREALEKLKIENEYYDESFFLFWEDFDIGWRADLLGIRRHFIPAAVAYHYRSGTMEQKRTRRFLLSLARSPDIKFHLVKNRYLTLIKNFRWRRFWWTLPFILVKDFLWVGALTLTAPKNIIRLLRCGRLIRPALRKRHLIKNHE